jgi:hypothetical protein
MSVEELEQAIAGLPADKLAEFRAWFEEFEAAHFDAQIEADAKSGKLDKLIEPSEEDFRAGRCREI